jgi:hypothetical protein
VEGGRALQREQEERYKHCTAVGALHGMITCMRHACTS